LTEVENVAVDFGTPQQRPLGMVTADELETHLRAGQFPPGSMGPKVQAALLFLRNGGTRAIITSPWRLAEAVASEGVGTQVVTTRRETAKSRAAGVATA
jgi:carbamate kinase